MDNNIYMFSDAEICRRIGQKMRGLRLRQNLTQSALAQMAQISLSTVKRMEDGETGSFDSLLRVLRILGELDIFTPLLKEEEMSPNEYYEFMKTVKKKQRKRATAQNSSDKVKTQQEESEW